MQFLSCGIRNDRLNLLRMLASKYISGVSNLSKIFRDCNWFPVAIIATTKPLPCNIEFFVFRSISFRSENYTLYFAERFRGLNQSYQLQCRSTEVNIIAGKSWSSFSGRYIQAQTKERTKHEEKPPDNGMFNITPSFFKDGKNRLRLSSQTGESVSKT